MSFAPGEERTLAEKWRSSVLDVFLFFHTARHTNMSQNSQAVCCEKASTNDMLTALSHYNRGGTLFLFYFCIFFFTMVMKKSQRNGIKLYIVLSLSLLCGSQNWIYILFFLWLVHLHIKC